MGLPTLEGQRVRLRQLHDRDLPALHAVFSDARVMRYWSHAPLRTMDDIAWYLRDIDAGRRHGAHYQWGIAQRTDDDVIGTLTVFAFDPARTRAEVGYALAYAHWGAGHAGESLRLALAFAFGALGLDTLDARVDPDNTVSLRLLVAAGFRDDSAAAMNRVETERGPRRHLSLCRSHFILCN